MVRDITIQIPLFNETEALRFSKYYFDCIGETVRYVLDVKCAERTRMIVRELGIEEVYFENDKPFIENGYESFAEASPTDWILRVDCDELPTPEMLTFARSAHLADGHVVAFERHQVLWDGNQFIAPAHDRFLSVNQRQFRMFNRKHASFNQSIHTPGIHVVDTVNAPSEAALFHLSWIYLSWEERLAKADRYDSFGQPEHNRANQLFPLDYHKWMPVAPSVVSTVYATWVAKRLTTTLAEV